jgi:CBS-domain-containing membrane protein
VGKAHGSNSQSNQESVQASGRHEELGDFSTSLRVLPISGLQRPLGELVRHETVEAFPDEPLRVVVYRMADRGITRLPVVERDTRKFLGLVSLDDLLKARARHLEEERRREQVLNLRFFLPGGGVPNETQSPAKS